MTEAMLSGEAQRMIVGVDAVIHGGDGAVVNAASRVQQIEQSPLVGVAECRAGAIDGGVLFIGGA